MALLQAGGLLKKLMKNADAGDTEAQYKYAFYQLKEQEYSFSKYIFSKIEFTKYMLIKILTMV